MLWPQFNVYSAALLNVFPPQLVQVFTGGGGGEPFSQAEASWRLVRLAVQRGDLVDKIIPKIDYTMTWKCVTEYTHTHSFDFVNEVSHKFEQSPSGNVIKHEHISLAVHSSKCSL